ncbi:MAG: hypothetical protein U0271_05470 [Polyangiaceae bacterium]
MVPVETRPQLELIKEPGNKRPTIRVHANNDVDAAPTEWASLLGDLSRPHAARALDVEWRVHDKTHLEFAIDYPFGSSQESYVWEAYFFVPESFRLAETTYDKKQIYDDLLSYVRLAVPELPFSELTTAILDGEHGTLLDQLRETLRAAQGSENGSVESRNAVRRLRVFACLVRASGLEAQRAMLGELDPKAALRAANAFAALTARVTGDYRAVLAESRAWSLPDEVGVALRWVDEDISLFVEALAGTASVELHQRATPNGGRGATVPAADACREAASRLASCAVLEARYRRDSQYPSVGTDDASPRDVEHIEFRRHVLKRFTSSVLWLRHEVRDASTWVLHGLYALAAAVAMTFAVIATLRATQMQGYWTLYVVLLVGSYAVKDRLKALLQTAFARWANKRFADRAWTIRDEERRERLGFVSERAAFRDFAKLPPGVLAARRLTREHALEEFARPEAVLWHEKSLTLEPRKQGTLPSPMMTEIFRLNIGPWLAHTDDPNRTITFADPDENVVCSVSARRVYNINVVYRLRCTDSKAEREPAWHRIRVVVSRKGIERIDPITSPTAGLISSTGVAPHPTDQRPAPSAGAQRRADG